MTLKELARRMACMAALCMATASWSAPASVCPAHASARVTQIDLFDGDPADMALLAPNDDQAGANTYSVKTIYDAHRILTIRCHYGAASEDVRLVKPVSICRYSGGATHPVLACK